MLSQFETYKIRKMSKSDAQEVVDLAIKSWKQEYKNIIDNDSLNNFSNKPFEEGRKMILEKDECSCIVATDEGGKVVGFSDAGKSWQSEPQEKEGEIYALYVESGHQRKSIGKNIFDQQVAYLKENGFNKLIIWTWENNKKSRSFYEKLGGVLSGSSEKEFEGKKYPTVQYKWSLR